MKNDLLPLRISYERLALAFRYVVGGDFQLEGIVPDVELAQIRFARTFVGTILMNPHLQLFEEQHIARVHKRRAA